MVEEILQAFPDAHVHSGYIRIRCPYHKDGNEQKPSMSILLEPRGNAEAGFCHCFACGKKTNIAQLFRDIHREPPPDIAQLPVQRRKPIALTTEPPVYKLQLPFRYSPYLESRGISRATQEKFKVYEKDKKVHMPVFDRKGKYLYSNARSTISKNFYVEIGAVKTLWGIEEIDLSKPIAVCESQIDAMSLWEAGIQAVATLGADNVNSLTAIKSCTSTIVLAFDPDEAGIRARKRAAIMLGKYRCKWLDLPPGVDINQALQDIKDITKFKNFICRAAKSFVQYKGGNKC